MTVIITGGAGFIGSNAAARFLALGHRVAVLDNLSRLGSAENLEWLRGQGLTDFAQLDVRDAAGVRRFVGEHRDATLILHLASQVAVTRAIEDPREDFEVNVAGTVNVLEAVRELWRDRQPAPLLVYASTNKVYGSLPDLPVEVSATRFEAPRGWSGVREDQPICPDTPHAVSKVAAESYLRAYSYSYGLPTVTFRQSCIYGPRQLGAEEQGWVAWLALCAVRAASVQLYGDGRQVRDLLHVDDLVDAFVAVLEQPQRFRGDAFNLGGGPGLTLSLRELLTRLERIVDKPIETTMLPWRLGDQKVYVSCIEKARTELRWQPRIDLERGLSELWDWVRSRS